MRHTLHTARLILFYLWGFTVLLGQAVLIGIVALWLLQFGAMMFGEGFDWAAVLTHVILSSYLLMLFPGQTLWTLRLHGPGGHLYTIVGDPKPPEKA